MLSASLLVMTLIYLAWFVILGIIPFIPFYFLALIFSAKKQKLKQKNSVQVKRLQHVMGHFLDTQKGWSAACCCLLEKNGVANLCMDFRLGSNEWNYHTKGINLSDAIDHLEKKLVKLECGTSSCVSGACPNYEQCPHRVETSNYQQLIHINHPAKLMA